MKVAVGFALACDSGACWYAGEIQAGYARVGVDEVLPGYESLELDMPVRFNCRTAMCQTYL